MTHKEIIQKAIQKAIDGGWEPVGVFGIDGFYLKGTGVYFPGNTTEVRFDIATVIFAHSFAKTLWGEQKHHTQSDDFHCINCGANAPMISVTHPEGEHHHQKCWQYHLQQMVIADDPIRYLGEHMDIGN